MPALDVHGEIAAAVIAFYAPIAILTLALTIRYGFSRDAGWIFLFTFSVVRIVGGAVFVAAELVKPANVGLYTAAYILESVGLSPLMLATIGFLGLVGKHAFSETPRMSRTFRVVGLLIIVAMTLSIVGGIDITSSKPSEQKKGVTLREVGAIMFVAVYGLLFLLHLSCWAHRHHIRRHHKALLTGISAALPFLGVRVVYTLLSAYSRSKPQLAKFDRINGDWKIFLVMSLVMEYVIVLIYVSVGTLIPLGKDDY